MLKNIAITVATLLLAATAPAQASSTGLLLNDDSIQIHHISEPAPLLGIETRLAYNFLYSQEPDPRNLLLSAEIEFPEQAWVFWDNHSLTPRLDLMAIDFMDRRFAAAAVGASYRIAPSDWHSFDLLTEATVAPQLTTLDKGKFLWTFKTQLNYPIAENIDLNFGYRSITVKLLNNYIDGFERGLYFGITTYFK